MSDLISRSELLEEIKSLSIVLNGKQIFSDDAKDTILRIINEQPITYSVDKVVEELEEAKHEICLSDDDLEYYQNGIDEAIEIVNRGGVDDDVCEYKIKDKVIYASCNNKQIASAFCWFNECGYYKYCPYCGKNIKVVE